MKTFKILIRDIFRFGINLNRINYAFLFLSFNLFGQEVSVEKLKGPSTEITELNCQVKFEIEFNSLTMKEDFKLEFEQEFQIDFSSFEELNPFDLSLIKKKISIEYCSKKMQDFDVKSQLFKYLTEFKENFLFIKPIKPETNLTRLGKYVTKPHHDAVDMWGVPKTLLCLNSGFEDQNFDTWLTYCAKTNNNLIELVDVNAYTPPANCPAPINGIAQHSIVTGGVDPFTGFPRVFPNGGGASALLGDATGVNSKASVITKTFVVDPTKTMLSYSYMAVLENPANHGPGDQPFFRARLYDQNGVSDTCAFYNSYGGDGALGWIVNGDMQYRDWTTILVPLNNYIGQTVTLELATGDCGLGAHFGYAYIDVTCDNLELQQICEGVSTVLVAPAGAAAYLWNTGETTEQITITTPGLYVCTITPIGSICSVDIPITATIFPIPAVNFIPSELDLCVGGEVEFVDNSDLSSGAIISSYEWDFGDGISTPASLGNIVGVAQTTGTYTLAQHTFTNVGNPIINLTAVTSDGCTVSDSITIGILSLPTATIVGSNTVCLNDTSPIITFTGANGVSPYTFTYNINGGASQTIVSTGDSASISIPTINATTFTYNLLYVSDSSLPCGQAQSGVANIVINPLPTAQLTGAATVCINDASPVITFSSTSGSNGYSFTYNINGGANQTITSSNSSTSISVPTSIAGTFVYNLLSITDLGTLCSQAQIQSVEVTIYPIPTATISGSDSVCLNDVSPIITFTGANGVAPYTFTYNINGGPDQTIVSNGNSATIFAPTNVATSLIYNLLFINDSNSFCGQAQNGSETIVISPLPTAVISGGATVCHDDAPPVVTFSSTSGCTNCMFQYNVNGGATQTILSDSSGSATLNVPTGFIGSFNYNLTGITNLETSCFQQLLQTVTIVVNPIPSASMTGSTTVCQNDPEPQVTFTGVDASPDYTFTFTINSDLNQLISQTVSQVVTTSGSNSVSVNVPTSVPGIFIYELTNVTALCSQDMVLTDTIVVNPLPQAQISLPIDICLNDDSIYYMVFGGTLGSSPYTFTYTVNGNNPQQISTNTGADTVAILIPTNVPSSLVYTIINIQSGGPLACEQVQSKSSSVTIHDLPDVFAGNDEVVCEDEEIVLQGSGAGFGAVYIWNSDVIDGVPFLPSDTIIYSVIGTDINGCKDTDQVVVDLVPIPVMAFDGINLSGCAPLQATFTNQSTGNLVDCAWDFGTGLIYNSCDSITITFTESGYFDVSLVVSTPEGCSNNMTLANYINVYSSPTASFSFTPDVLSNYDWEAIMTNNSSGAVSYLWDFGDGSMNSTQVNPIHAYPNDEGGSYVIELIATSSQGCVDTAYQTIELIEESLFYVPNTFTPDGNRYNEVFKPVYAPGFNPAGYKLMIFNRWGEVIFESQDIDYGWNGYYKELVSQDGTYTWKITFKTAATAQHKEYIGHVNLIK